MTLAHEAPQLALGAKSDISCLQSSPPTQLDLHLFIIRLDIVAVQEDDLPDILFLVGEA